MTDLQGLEDHEAKNLIMRDHDSFTTRFLPREHMHDAPKQSNKSKDKFVLEEVLPSLCDSKVIVAATHRTFERLIPMLELRGKGPVASERVPESPSFPLNCVIRQPEAVPRQPNSQFTTETSSSQPLLHNTVG